MIEVSETNGGATFTVKASAGAKRNAVVGVHGAALKVAVSAPRDRGKANEALTEVLAAALGVSKTAVSLGSGAPATHKRVRLLGKDATTPRPPRRGVVRKK